MISPSLFHAMKIQYLDRREKQNTLFRILHSDMIRDAHIYEEVHKYTAAFKIKQLYKNNKKMYHFSAGFGIILWNVNWSFSVRFRLYFQKNSDIQGI